ncbi:MAG: PhzF family phenazine biosynthesis protein [Candidatus Thorarchaeota archaeon]|nr:MAG: PhzF family phenazine biosynthesis protein [Candidatus Thorarchaeota archaeon]
MKHRRELTVVQVDAFTDVPFGGNPAAVILGADRVNEETMLKIAREMNVRETVFVSSSKVADFKFRFMTPKTELAFSGHPTVAAFHALTREGHVEVVDDVAMFSLETKAGVLEVEIVKNETTGRNEVQIFHQRPQFMRTYDPRVYAEALGLTLADVLSPNPIQTVSTGTPHLMVPITTMRAMERIEPDWNRLKELREDADYVSIQVFSRETLEVTSDAHARHFAPALGIYEDPVSGSGAGAMGSYMVKQGIMDSTNRVTSIVIEQGQFVGRPGKVFVEVIGDQDEIQQVKVSGTAVRTLRGTLYI